MERAQHPRDVPERRAFDPAFAQRPCRLSLEIDNDEIPTRVEDLPEVIISVRANPRRIDFPLENRTIPSANIAFQVEDLLRSEERRVGKEWRSRWSLS